MEIRYAGGGNRTHTRVAPDWILSPARLPVPPLRPAVYLYAISPFFSTRAPPKKIASSILMDLFYSSKEPGGTDGTGSPGPGGCGRPKRRPNGDVILIITLILVRDFVGFLFPGRKKLQAAFPFHGNHPEFSRR